MERSYLGTIKWLIVSSKCKFPNVPTLALYIFSYSSLRILSTLLAVIKCTTPKFETLVLNSSHRSNKPSNKLGVNLGQYNLWQVTYPPLRCSLCQSEEEMKAGSEAWSAPNWRAPEEGEGPDAKGEWHQGKHDLKGKWDSISIPLEHPGFAFDLKISK